MKDIQDKIRKALVGKMIIDIEISSETNNFNELKITISDNSIIYIGQDLYDNWTLK